MKITSSIDKIAFTFEMKSRFMQLVALCQKKTGSAPLPPDSILTAIKLWRGMLKRYEADRKEAEGIMLRQRLSGIVSTLPATIKSWHTRAEQQAEQDMAQWVIDETHRLRGTTPDEPFEPRTFD